MKRMKMPFKMLGKVMDLGMAVMAGRNAVSGPGVHDLVKFNFPVIPSGFRQAGLEKTAAPAAAKIIGPVGMHLHEIFFSDHRFHNKPEIFGHRIPKTFSDQLARVLDRKFDAKIFVPVGTDRKLSLLDPLGIVLDNALDFKGVRNVEFFESDPDCEKFVPSFGIEPDLAAQIFHCFCLEPDNFLPVFIVRGKKAVIFSCPSF